MNYRLRLEMLEDRCVPSSLGGMTLGHEAASFATAHPARTASTRPIAAVERVPQVHAASPSASLAHAASPLAAALRTQETTSARATSSGSITPFAYANSPAGIYGAIYASYAYRYAPSNSTAETDAYYANYYGTLGYLYGNQTYYYYGEYYAYQAYLYANSGSNAQRYALLAYYSLYAAYQGF